MFSFRSRKIILLFQKKFDEIFELLQFEILINFFPKKQNSKKYLFPWLSRKKINFYSYLWLDIWYRIFFAWFLAFFKILNYLELKIFYSFKKPKKFSFRYKFLYKIFRSKLNVKMKWNEKLITVTVNCKERFVNIRLRTKV